VLSSFFYGYIVTQVLGGWLASRYGGKHVFGVGVLVTLVATMLVPLAARNHVALLVALRVIMGLACVRAVHLPVLGIGCTSTRYIRLFHRRTRASYVYNVCLVWYNVVLTPRIHSSVKFVGLPLATRATVE